MSPSTLAVLSADGSIKTILSSTSTENLYFDICSKFTTYIYLLIKLQH